MSECIFKLGLIDKKLLIPLLYSILMLFNDYVYLYPRDETNIYIEYAGNSFGEMMTMIIPYIFKIKTRKNNEKRCTKDNIKDYFFLLLIFTLLKAADIIILYFIEEEEEKNTYRLCIIEGIEIIIILGISLIFLKYKYYIHHIISLILFIILSLVIDIMLNNIQYINIDSILTQIIYIIIESTYYCYIKYMLEIKYHYYWNIIFIRGIYNLFISLIIFGILLTIKILTNNHNILVNLDYYYNNVYIIIIHFIIEIIIGGFIFSLLEMKSLSEFSPNHIFACLEISKIPNEFIGNNNNLLSWLSIIPIILQIISLLFYLEIFEYNFCNLNKDTKRNIQIREKNDSLDLETEEKQKNIELIPGYLIEESEQKEDEEANAP